MGEIGVYAVKWTQKNITYFFHLEDVEIDCHDWNVHASINIALFLSLDTNNHLVISILSMDSDITKVSIISLRGSFEILFVVVFSSLRMCLKDS